MDFEQMEKLRLQDLMISILDDGTYEAWMQDGTLDDMLCLQTIADIYFGNELDADEMMTAGMLGIGEDM